MRIAWKYAQASCGANKADDDVQDSTDKVTGDRWRRLPCAQRLRCVAKVKRE